MGKDLDTNMRRAWTLAAEWKEKQQLYDSQTVVGSVITALKNEYGEEEALNIVLHFFGMTVGNIQDFSINILAKLCLDGMPGGEHEGKKPRHIMVDELGFKMSVYRSLENGTRPPTRSNTAKLSHAVGLKMLNKSWDYPYNSDGSKE